MAGMKIDAGSGEVILADTCQPISGLVFPFLESVVITGVCWMGIGWMDANGLNPLARNLVLGLWVLMLLVRLLIPTVSSRRRRFMVTNRRVLARAGRGGVDSIPLEQIHSVGRARGGLTLSVYGFDRPLYYPTVGKAKKVEKLLSAQLPVARYR